MLGHKVVVLEAKDRPGGRVYSKKLEVGGSLCRSRTIKYTSTTYHLCLLRGPCLVLNVLDFAAFFCCCSYALAVMLCTLFQAALFPLMVY